MVAVVVASVTGRVVVAVVGTVEVTNCVVSLVVVYPMITRDVVIVSWFVITWEVVTST